MDLGVYLVVDHPHGAVAEDEVTSGNVRAAETQPEVVSVEEFFFARLGRVATARASPGSAIGRVGILERARRRHPADVGAGAAVLALVVAQIVPGVVIELADELLPDQIGLAQTIFD